MRGRPRVECVIVSGRRGGDRVVTQHKDRVLKPLALSGRLGVLPALFSQGAPEARNEAQPG